MEYEVIPNNCQECNEPDALISPSEAIAFRVDGRYLCVKCAAKLGIEEAATILTIGDP